MSDGGNPFTRFAFASAAARSSSRASTIQHASAAKRPTTAPAPDDSGRVKREDATVASIARAAERSSVSRTLKRERSASPPPPPSLPLEAQAVGGKKTRRGDSVELQHEEDGSDTVDRRLSLLRELLRARERMETPIDQFGTQACVFETAGASTRRFQLLVAALLSSQTRDEITFAAMQRLHKHSNDTCTTLAGAKEQGLTIASVLDTSETALSELLKPVGFYRRKAHQVKRVAGTLRAQFDEDVPRSLDELEALPGIGPKIARVILLLAWGRVDGVIVDTHVHRLAQRFGWTTDQQRGAGEAKTTTPEDTRRELEAWLPREYWGGLSLAVVGFGQTVCTAKRPKCATCPIAHLCPSAFKVGR